MGAFESFVESKFFFPVLIGMLLLLIAIFVFILIFDRKKEKQYMKELKEELGSDDQTKTIQIPVQKVVKQVVVKKDPELTQTIQIPTLKKEEPEEVEEEKSDDKGLDLSKTVAPTVLKENPVNKHVEERTEIADDAPVVDLKITDTESDESLEATQVIQAHEEAYPDDEIIVPEEVKQVEEEEEGEEIAAPEAAVQLEDEGTSVIEIPKVEEDEIKQVEIEKPNAFETKADGNTDINEDIKYEPPKEYTGVKTEVLDLSDIVDKEE